MTSADDFFRSFGAQKSVYSSEAFISLNAKKADAVRCFVGMDADGRYSLGIVAGFREGVWHAPFSAPYSSLYHCKEAPSTEEINDFLSELTHLLGDNQLRLTLHPQFIDDEMWNRTTLVASKLASRTFFDYNYHFPLDECDTYSERLTPEARRHLKRAEKQGFDFSPTDDIRRVYDIISRHHQAKGYRMAMSLDDVMRTAEVIASDFFVLTLNDIDIAATYTQRVAPGVAQLINWGDERRYSSMRPMNMMAYRLCKHYANLGFKVFDFGPASTDGIPNIGLCRFKESVGGKLTLKPTFIF